MQSAFRLAVTGQSLIKHDIRDINAPAFHEVRQLLRQADLAFTNFEGTISGSHGGWPLKGSFFGSSEPIVLDALEDTGFGALSLSNNHAFDLGPSGVLSTLTEVERRGFLYAGLGRNHTEAAQARTGMVHGRQIAMLAMDGGPGPDFMYAADASANRPARPGVNRLRLLQILEVDADAFERLSVVRDKVGYTPMDLTNDSQPDDPPDIELEAEIGIARAIFRRSGKFGRGVKVDRGDLSRNLAAIASAADRGCLVIAYLHHHHWASDWHQVPDWISPIAKQCIDAGAAIFVSHGAPVLQPVEIYRHRPIFYSLGNFIFHVRSENSVWTAPEVWESIVGMCTFDQDNHLIRMTLHPVSLGGDASEKKESLERRLAPELVTGARAERILGRFAQQCDQLGTRIRIKDGVGVLRL